MFGDRLKVGIAKVGRLGPAKTNEMLPSSLDLHSTAFDRSSGKDGDNTGSRQHNRHSHVKLI